MIQAFIFDIGKVILDFDFQPALQRLSLQSSPFDQGELNTLKLSYESGKISRLEFLETSHQLLNFTGTTEEFTHLWQNIFHLNSPMVELIESLAPRYPLYLLSNTNDLHVEHFTEKFSVFSHFSGAIYSHEVQLMKPDPAIYAEAVRQFKVDPQSTVFIDDLAPNIESARKAGFHAIQYDLNAHDALLQSLSNLGVR